MDATPITARRFTLDDEPCDIAEFCTLNAIDHEEQLRIGDLPVGGEMTFGGGAAASFTLKRTR
jgi:hypothetical protein